jgi:hypothetical protein
MRQFEVKLKPDNNTNYPYSSRCYCVSTFGRTGANIVHFFCKCRLLQMSARSVLLLEEPHGHCAHRLKTVSLKVHNRAFAPELILIRRVN